MVTGGFDISSCKCVCRGETIPQELRGEGGYIHCCRWFSSQVFLQHRKDSGSFDLGINGLTITTSIAIKSDETGRPAVSSVNCVTDLGSAKVKFHGGAR